MLKRNMKSNSKKKRKGQSTVEYLVLVAGVLAAFIYFLRPQGPFHRALNTTLEYGANEMLSVANRLSNSHQ